MKFFYKKLHIAFNCAGAVYDEIKYIIVRVSLCKRLKLTNEFSSFSCFKPKVKWEEKSDFSWLRFTSVLHLIKSRLQILLCKKKLHISIKKSSENSHSVVKSCDLKVNLSLYSNLSFFKIWKIVVDNKEKITKKKLWDKKKSLILVLFSFSHVMMMIKFL